MNLLSNIHSSSSSIPKPTRQMRRLQRMITTTVTATMKIRMKRMKAMKKKEEIQEIMKKAKTKTRTKMTVTTIPKWIHWKHTSRMERSSRIGSSLLQFTGILVRPVSTKSLNGMKTKRGRKSKGKSRMTTQIPGPLTCREGMTYHIALVFFTLAMSELSVTSGILDISMITSLLK